MSSLFIGLSQCRCQRLLRICCHYSFDLPQSVADGFLGHVVIIPLVLPQAVDEELLCDVVLAVGVLKGQVELVVRVEHRETFAVVRPGTPGKNRNKI